LLNDRYRVKWTVADSAARYDGRDAWIGQRLAEHAEPIGPTHAEREVFGVEAAIDRQPLSARPAGSSSSIFLCDHSAGAGIAVLQNSLFLWTAGRCELA